MLIRCIYCDRMFTSESAIENHECYNAAHWEKMGLGWDVSTKVVFVEGDATAENIPDTMRYDEFMEYIRK